MVALGVRACDFASPEVSEIFFSTIDTRRNMLRKVYLKYIYVMQLCDTER